MKIDIYLFTDIQQEINYQLKLEMNKKKMKKKKLGKNPKIQEKGPPRGPKIKKFQT